jgi:hypothetical protein
MFRTWLQRRRQQSTRRTLTLEPLEGRVVPSFAPAVVYPTGAGIQSVTVGDLNHDNKPDLVVGNSDSGTIGILLANGDGTFLPQTADATGVAPIGTALGDFNGDGNPDLAVANAGSNTLGVLLGNGNGTFQPESTYSVPNPGVVVVNDFNHDTKLDIAVCNSADNAVRVLLGDGAGHFQSPVRYDVGSYTEGLQAGDFNGDNNLDFVAGCANNVSVLLGRGDGTFQPFIPYATGSRILGIGLGDYNRDGKLDIAAASYNDSNVTILLGKGDGSFQSGVAYPVGAGASYTMAVGDFNGDSKLDLATPNYITNNISLLQGNGDGSFQPARSLLTGGNRPIAVAAADLNGDGAPDLAVTNSASNNVAVLLNQPDATHFGISTQTSTTTPGEVSVTVRALTGFGHPATTYRGAIHFSSSDPQAILPANYTFKAADSGVHTFAVTLKTPGTQNITVAPKVSGVVAYYRFDEGFGTNVINTVTNAVDGTHNIVYSANVPVNTVPQTGQVDSASFQVAGTSATITGQDFIFNKGYGDATLEWWLNVPDENHSSIFWTRADATDANRFNIAISPHGYFGVDYREANGQIHRFLTGDATVTLPLNTWFHLAITRIGQTYQFYQNGFLIYTATDSNPNLPDDGPWTIDGRSGYPFTGLLDEVRMTPRALDPTELLDTAPIPSSSASLTVAGAINFLVTGFPSPTTAGSSNSLQVEARDADGNTLTAYRGKVHFTSTDPKALLPADYTFTDADQGVHVFTAILKTAGTQALTAKDTADATVTGTQSGIVVNPAAAQTLLVSGFPGTTTAGAAHDFSVTAKDLYGNNVTSYRGTVHFGGSDLLAVLPANYTFTASDGGTHSFTATLKLAGTQTLIATDTAVNTLTGKQTIKVNTAAAVTLLVSGFPASVTAGTAYAFVVIARDAFGNVATGYRGSIHFTSDDPNAILPADYTFTASDNGVHTFVAILNTPGTRFISAKDKTRSSIFGEEDGIAVS